ncbi:MFS transporter [Streptomyces spirodelae]|uniref:MFS transporter n=1 Tax=Streptomyces spirodelae TaxID=2812904 RepID=A0ABS3WY16_9ACTN|nr:MFS transporter [Streptomyces spirodelae]MBO8188029.1 MFS transporter [Streptomyces spirodelae]
MLAGRTAPGGIDLPATRRRVQLALVVSQILGGLGVSTAVALAAVLAEEVGGSEAVAGLASTSSVIGTALLSLPFAALMARRGRRVGLTSAYAVAAVGGLVVVTGAAMRNFPLLLVGMAAFGASNTANLQARFAAADLAEPLHRARAISTVVWATTIGAVLGPNIAAPAGKSVSGLGIPEAAGPFLWGTAVFLAAGAVLHLLLRPDPLLTARALARTEAPRAAEEAVTGAEAVVGAEGAAREEHGRSAHQSSDSERSLRAGIRAVAASAPARVALASIAGSHTVMVSVMVMTPVDLGGHGAGVELIGLVISGHITGMYAFSPVMGWLADRIGRFSVILIGVALLGCATALAGTADGNHVQSAVGLFLLGLGWSAGLVSGSALLTDSVPQQARAAVQGFSDLIMNSAAGVGGALSGLVVAQAGYGWLNLLAAALLVPVAAVTVAVAARR